MPLTFFGMHLFDVKNLLFHQTQIISFIVTVVRERKSYISGEIDDDDFDESDDDDMVRA